MKVNFYIVLCCCLFFCKGFVYGQRENVWTFGYNAGVNFNMTPPASFTSSIYSVEAAASICDNAGQLLFYTEGNNVWNKYNNLMPNGASLITDITYGSLGPTSSTCGGAIIVPFISDANRYYVFSLTQMGPNYGRLYRSTVDMTLNGGLGDVIATQKGILVDSQNTEHLTAVPGNHCNIWLLTLATPSNTTLQIKAYEITDAGINNTPVTSNFVIPFTLTVNLGQMDVSPNRDRIAVSRLLPFVNGGAAELFSFDPVTGIASNHIMLDSAGNYGVAFSPDGSKLYRTANGLSQYDLSLPTTTAVIASRTDISTSPSGIIKRGPDGRMYVNDNGVLAAVNYPNLPGAACGFSPNAISFSGSAFYSLPNVVPLITHDTFHHAYPVSAPCFAGTTTLIAANDTTGWDYVWSTGASGLSAMVENSGAYYVSYRTPPCNFNTDTFHVKFETRLPDLSAIAGCYGQDNGVIRAIPYPGDTTTYTYTWKDAGNTIIQGPLSTHTGDTLNIAVNGDTYSINVLGPNGCDTILQIAVPMPGYHASFSVSDTLVCVEEAVTFQNTSTVDISGFNWQFGDGTSSNDENPLHEYPAPGVYMVQLTGSTRFPCYDTVYRRIVVDSITGGRFEINKDSICTGETIEFTPYTDSATTRLEWYFGDDAHVLNAAPQPILHAYDQSGALLVTLLSHSRACPPVSYADTVHVFSLPIVNLGVDTALCLDGNPLYLRNMYTDNTVVIQSLQWSTGDTMADIKVVHPGRYSLTLRAAPIGCSTTDEIEVKKDCYIDIPNVFTPNDDGVNDYFFPRQLLSKSLSAFRMSVFNRWGQVIFETANLDGRGLGWPF